MRDTNREIRIDIKSLEKEVEKQRKYAEINIIPYMRTIADKVNLRDPFRIFNKTYSYCGLKLIISTSAIKYRRRRKLQLRIEITLKYKYRTVFRYKYDKGEKFTKLEVFHACEWLNYFGGLLHTIEEEYKEETLKIEHERLKGELKKLKKKCGDFDSSCVLE